MLLADKRSSLKQVLELSHLRGQRGGNWWSGIWDLCDVMKSSMKWSLLLTQVMAEDKEDWLILKHWVFFFKWLSKEKLV